jgi:hypothetical protein
MAKGQSLSLLSAGWCEVNSICDKLVQQLVCKGKLRTAVHGRLFGWTSIGTADRFAMSDPGCHVALFDSLPGDVGALAETVQGLHTLPLPTGCRLGATSKLSRMFALSRTFSVTS